MWHGLRFDPADLGFPEIVLHEKRGMDRNSETMKKYSLALNSW